VKLRFELLRKKICYLYTDANFGVLTKGKVMFKFIKFIFSAKTLISTSAQIKSGYSAGKADGSSSGQWYNN